MTSNRIFFQAAGKDAVNFILCDGLDVRLHAIRKFMEMRTLTKQVLNELIDHIDVYETQGDRQKRTSGPPAGCSSPVILSKSPHHVHSQPGP